MADFEIRQLRYFVEAAELGSMSQAAKRLFVSQQALSKGIASLEASLGAELLVRDKSGVAPTAFGRFFLERARTALVSVDALGSSLEDFRAGAARTIALGMTPRCMSDFGGTLNARRLYALHRAYPGVTFEFREVPSAEIEPLLRADKLQFGITAPLDEHAYASRLLATFPLSVLVSRENPLSRKAAVTPEDLARGVVAVATSDNLTPLLARLGKQAGRAIPVSPIQIDPVDGAELVVSPSTFVIRPEQHARRTTSTTRVAIVPLVDAAGAPVCVPLSLCWKRTLHIGEPERLLMSYMGMLYDRREQDDPAPAEAQAQTQAQAS